MKSAQARRAARYGLSVPQLRKLLAMKKGCWVCGRTKRRDGRRAMLFVDHDHRNGRVRGVLCFTHNKHLVGRHRDGRLLRAAAEYLDSTFDARDIAA